MSSKDEFDDWWEIEHDTSVPDTNDPMSMNVLRIATMMELDEI